MKAAFIQKHGDLEELQTGELNTPKISPNEVLIETKFAALNHLDIFVVKGWSGLNLVMPHVLGSDGSGIVKEVGSEVSTIKKGDLVTVNPGVSCGKCAQCLAGKQNFCSQFSILGEHRWGTFAQFYKVPEINVLKIPANYSLDKAAAAPLTFLTAWRMLVTQARVKQDEYVFIHGAGGGVSVAAVQIAKYLGAKVVATTSAPKKVDLVKKLGADYVINYKEMQDYGKYVFSEITKKSGIDVVIDSVGTPTFPNSLRLLRPGGRLVTCGVTSGPMSEIDIRQIFWKQLEVKGSTMSNQKEFRDVMKLVFEGKLTPIIDKIFSLEQAKEAETYLNKGTQFGKVLLKIS